MTQPSLLFYFSFQRRPPAYTTYCHLFSMKSTHSFLKTPSHFLLDMQNKYIQNKCCLEDTGSLLLAFCRHSQVHKYLDRNTIFIVSPLYTTTKDLKLNHQEVTEVWPFSFNARHLPKILHYPFRNYSHFPLSLHFQ